MWRHLLLNGCLWQFTPQNTSIKSIAVHASGTNRPIWRLTWFFPSWRTTGTFSHWVLMRLWSLMTDACSDQLVLCVCRGVSSRVVGFIPTWTVYACRDAITIFVLWFVWFCVLLIKRIGGLQLLHMRLFPAWVVFILHKIQFTMLRLNVPKTSWNQMQCSESESNNWFAQLGHLKSENTVWAQAQAPPGGRDFSAMNAKEQPVDSFKIVNSGPTVLFNWLITNCVDRTQLLSQVLQQLCETLSTNLWGLWLLTKHQAPQCCRDVAGA